MAKATSSTASPMIGGGADRGREGEPASLIWGRGRSWGAAGAVLGLGAVGGQAGRPVQSSYGGGRAGSAALRRERGQTAGSCAAAPGWRRAGRRCASPPAPAALVCHHTSLSKPTGGRRRPGNGAAQPQGECWPHCEARDDAVRFAQHGRHDATTSRSPCARPHPLPPAPAAAPASAPCMQQHTRPMPLLAARAAPLAAPACMQPVQTSGLPEPRCYSASAVHYWPQRAKKPPIHMHTVRYPSHSALALGCAPPEHGAVGGAAVARDLLPLLARLHQQLRGGVGVDFRL